MSEAAREAIHEDAPQQLALDVSVEEMVAATEKASILLELMFAARAPEAVIKALFLNVHGLLTALVPHIGADTVKMVFDEFLLPNVRTVQDAIDAERGTEH
jgi:hypothetical protein